MEDIYIVKKTSKSISTKHKNMLFKLDRFQFSFTDVFLYIWRNYGKNMLFKLDGFQLSFSDTKIKGGFDWYIGKGIDLPHNCFTKKKIHGKNET